ncbi:hypothetical protein [Pseudomonas synxantha]|uniref:Isopentenyl-diphosphate delta-isomerase n=1 Tax=Pseudomonas synxantha TaxID=47883 RepID=A0AAX3I8D1_9PSED|nr:hypothetical protein [Pseudomonas synxantha]AZE67194.1 Isopentenyl-diphosphate delta-isomerase [Pseudomonas synxantha]KRP55923.1 hypothetical protein TU77_06395 [Pseudomonas synxantha]MDQ0981243.1 hypothetical protein [Pseudomonas synxantha]SDU28587.1 hypothetical protein SAMN05216475_2167 [Pseudomonas synxantha]VTQ99409.1 isopentenyl-diphosphate delta-isomerase [Pseudomonas synxantha]
MTTTDIDTRFLTDIPGIRVMTHNAQIGVCDKREAHLGVGRLHRAFSVHLIDSQGRHLLQRRAAGKMRRLLSEHPSFDTPALHSL